MSEYRQLFPNTGQRARVIQRLVPVYTLLWYGGIMGDAQIVLRLSRPRAPRRRAPPVERVAAARSLPRSSGMMTATRRPSAWGVWITTWRRRDARELRAPSRPRRHGLLAHARATCADQTPDAGAFPGPNTGAAWDHRAHVRVLAALWLTRARGVPVCGCAASVCRVTMFANAARCASTCRVTVLLTQARAHAFVASA